MPEVINVFGVQVQGLAMAVLVFAPFILAVGLALWRVAVLERREHVEALERIRRRDVHPNSNDVRCSGDDWHVGKIVRAEKP